MAKSNIIAICILIMAIVIDVSFHWIYKTKTINKQEAKKGILVMKQKNNPILTPDPKSISVLGSSTSAGLTTYTSQDGGYRFTYPATWTPSTLDQMKNFNGDISVFTTGPVGRQILGYPSFIQIAVDQNPQDLSIESFVKKDYGNVKLTQTTIGTYSAEMTSDVHSAVSNTIYLTKPKQKIYQIRFYDGAEPKIDSMELQAIFKSFQIK